MTYFDNSLTKRSTKSSPDRRVAGEDNDDNNNKDHHDHPMLRPVALFLDGMSRAVILPFGPSLVHRLLFGGTGKLRLHNCSKIAYALAIVVASYLLGRSLGNSIAPKLSFLRDTKRLPRNVARLAGLAVSLHVFILGGLTSVWWLVIIRFLSATLVGILCSITRPITTTHDTSDDLNIEEELTEEDDLELGRANNNASSGARRRDGYVDMASGTAKIYMTSFSVSILSGGLIYRHATGDATFQALTGSNRFTVSPLFLVAVSITAESILRCVFALFHPIEKSNPTDNRSTLGTKAQSPLSPARNIDQYGIPQKESDDLLAFLTPAETRTRLESTASDKYSHGRDRLASTDSEFFDCNSAFSDMEDALLDDQELMNEPTIARYVDRKCVYADGSPAFVPQGDSPEIVPPNYLAFCGGKNKKKAQEMWKATQKWRYERNIWRVHTMPNTYFSKIKQCYPHFVHGFSKRGYPIIYEQPGKMDLKGLFRGGCKISDMIHHYTFFLEFVANSICTRDEIRAKLGPDAAPHSSSSWGTMVVLDVKGAGISHLSTDVLRYLQQASNVNSAHYPLTIKRAFVVNCNFWLAGAWSTAKGVLPDSVQVDILSAEKYGAALREYIDDDQIPPEYGGSSPYRLGEHPFEIELCKLVDEANECGQEVDDLPEVAPPDFLSPEPKYSFDHNTNSWTKEVDGVTTQTEEVDNGLVSSSWNSTLSRPSQQNPLRRRATSVDNNSRLPVSFVPQDDEASSSDDVSHDGKNKGCGGEGDIFVIVSIMYLLCSAIQGVIETAIPLWILTPTVLGGLGYAPSRSGVAMFCSAIMLLWVMRTKFSRVVSQLPGKAPMRSFRIGMGAESVLLLLLAIVPKSASPSKRCDTVLIMTFTIIIIACIVLSSMLGRSSSTILHRIASTTFAQHRRNRPISIRFISSYYPMDRLLSDCQTGQLTYYLQIVGELIGVLAIGPICSWSLGYERPAPFDGTCCLFISSLVTLVLYVCSFSLHLNVIGEFTPHPQGDRCTDIHHARRCGSFLCEVVTVSCGDMASLFEETNWTMTPLLGNTTMGRQIAAYQHQHHHNDNDNVVVVAPTESIICNNEKKTTKMNPLESATTGTVAIVKSV